MSDSLGVDVIGNRHCQGKESREDPLPLEPWMGLVLGSWPAHWARKFTDFCS